MGEVCGECGHPVVNHGDRAVAACDGGYETNGHRQPVKGHGKAVCPCPGWRSDTPWTHVFVPVSANEGEVALGPTGIKRGPQIEGAA